MAAAYPSYRQPRMHWLPPVPAHWNEQRAKTFFFEVDERSKTGQEELLSVSHLTGVTPRSQKKVTMFKASSYVGAKLCRPGDIVINTLWAWMAALGASKHVGIVSPAYGVYRSRQADSFNPSYLDYLLRTRAYVTEYIGRSTGVQASRLRLYPNQFLDITVLQPPRPEQDQIVAYLRAQDAHIARFIKAKRDLIALLTEQRLRVIHEAVTCGIDVTGEQKYSGVEWIGNIPKHWVVAALNSRYRIDLGKMLDESSITGEHLIPYLRNQDVQWGHVRTNYLPEMDIRPSEIARYTLQKGDLLVCEGGDIGRSAFWDGSISPCGYQKALHRVRPRSSAQDEPRYLYYLLYLASKRGIFIADGSINTIAHLTAEKLRRYRFCFPPYEEQKKISEWLDSSLAYVEKAISSATEEIDLIREYRNKVVADVVTGQIDVRAWQPGPDDLITEDDLTALGGDDDIDTTEEESDGDDT